MSIGYFLCTSHRIPRLRRIQELSLKKDKLKAAKFELEQNLFDRLWTPAEKEGSTLKMSKICPERLTN